MNITAERCACGLPLHYSSIAARKMVQRFIALLGPTLDVRLPDGHGWKVPRHYLALHGIRGETLDQVARELGFEAAPDTRALRKL